MRRTTHYQAPIAAPATPSRSSRLVAKLGDQVDVIIVLVYLEQSVDVGGVGEELENLGFFLQAITDIWEARNEKLWLNRSPNPHITFQRAMCLLDDWRQAQPPRFTTHQLDEQYIEKWTKPEEGWLKANVDATFDFANNKMDL
nr:cytochrome P450 [Ipomoea batatas]